MTSWRRQRLHAPYSTTWRLTYIDILDSASAHRYSTGTYCDHDMILEIINEISTMYNSLPLSSLIISVSLQIWFTE